VLICSKPSPRPLADRLSCPALGILQQHPPPAAADGPPLPRSDGPPVVGSVRPCPPPAARLAALAVADHAAPLPAAAAACSGVAVSSRSSARTRSIGIEEQAGGQRWRKSGSSSAMRKLSPYHCREATSWTGRRIMWWIIMQMSRRIRPMFCC